MADLAQVRLPIRLQAPAWRLPDIVGEIEAQASRWFLWAPVAFGGGAAVYLNLRSEPPAWLAFAPLAAVAMAVLAARGSRRAPLILTLLLAFFCAGFAVAQLRTRAVDVPAIAKRTQPVAVEGWVVDVASPGAGGPRLVLAPTRISGVPSDRLPRRVRVTIKPDQLVGPGEAVRLVAILNPSPGPAAPGAYDFARDAFFEGIGGVGFTVKPPTAVELPPPPPRLRSILWLNAFRWSLSQRLVQRLGPRVGGVAAAMTTGHEAWLERSTLDAMRDSGLAHVLSISGLHMAVVGGFVFFAMRGGLAAWPWAALRFNIKKVAAVCGLVAIGGYLLISGAPPPAERAAVTAAVAFIAILLDRRAITLRALAIAALVVMAVRPEAVVQPGFQMSFSATAALIALAERWPRPIREINAPWPIVAVQRGAGWVGLTCAISFVAGIATGPFAVQHFNRMAAYGLVANLLVAPLSSLIIMPMLAIGAVLEMFGLGGPFLQAAGWGISGMLWIAETVAGWPGAVANVPSAPSIALPLAFVGLLWVCLWQGQLRWLGAPFVAAVLLWPRPEPPVGWLAQDGSNIALVRGQRAAFTRPGEPSFAGELWARRRGLAAAEDAAVWRCDRRLCRSQGGRPYIALSRTLKPPKPEQWPAICAGADLVVLRSRATPPQGLCAHALVLGPEAFDRGGSAEIVRGGAGWRVEWSNTLRGQRPWTR